MIPPLIINHQKCEQPDPRLNRNRETLKPESLRFVPEYPESIPEYPESVPEYPESVPESVIFVPEYPERNPESALVLTKFAPAPDSKSQIIALRHRSLGEKPQFPFRQDNGSIHRTSPPAQGQQFPNPPCSPCSGSPSALRVRLRRSDRMPCRTAPLQLRCANASAAAGSPIAAINVPSGRGVVRPPRSFLACRPLDRSFFRFTALIACSSRQRRLSEPPEVRRRMAALRFWRLLTLCELIFAISEPVLRSVLGSASFPLRGSAWQHRSPSGSCRQGSPNSLLTPSVAALFHPLRGDCPVNRCLPVIPAGVVGGSAGRQGSPPMAPTHPLPAATASPSARGGRRQPPADPAASIHADRVR